MTAPPAPAAPDATRSAFDRIIAVGMRRWKAHNLSPLLAAHCQQLHFVRSCTAARALSPGADDAIAVWGAMPAPGINALAAQTGAALLRLEDGFIRSVGLGSDFIPPQSLVMDRSGIYFDATQTSDLERVLQTRLFTAAELAEAADVRQVIVSNGLTKYNIEPHTAPNWPSKGKRIVLVPGQVETDASIALGAADIRSNLALLRAVRSIRPDAWIVYKPHPDVMSGNRRGRVALGEAAAIADWIETDSSIVSCIDASDEVHTITSLSGFDALLRCKPVVTYGAPFYAGWGLTEDRAGDMPAWSRRSRRLTLDELVAGALLTYPFYWDTTFGNITDCKTVLLRIAQSRALLQSTGKLEQLRSGWTRRQFRKLKVLRSVAWWGHTP